MAYWLKAAEDLFEVVDRKAKHVADELSEEQQIASQSSAFKGQEIQSKSSKSKNKARLKTSITELSRLETRKQDQKNDAVSISYLETEEKLTLPSETMVDTVKDIRNEKNTEPSHDNDKVKISSTTTGKDDVNAANDVSGVDLVTSSLKVSDIALKKSEDKIEESSSQPSEEKVEILAMDHSSNPDAEGNLVNDNVSIKIDVNRAEVDMLEVNNMDAVEENGKETFPLPSSNLSSRKLYEHVTETPMKVQDELEEAQGLLKTSVSTGQSKEARLVRVCAGLSSRLQEYKSENAQLEELLIAERELCTSYQAHIKQLQKEVSAKRVEVSTAESNMAEALAAKNSEIETLMSSLDSLKKQASSSDLKLSSLQADMETIVRSRELSETRMLQALREELVSAEHRAEEERIAHSSTKMAAVEREVELEHRAVEASNALARIQRTAEEGASRIMELEHKIALLEVECGSLNQELQEMEARARRGQKKSNDEANQNLQVQAWQEEVERAHQGQRDADTKISSLEAELQKMRVEMAGMKRDAEHYSRHEHIELEKRYRELTDLLYHKQTQLETMVSQKAAAEFQLEKVIMRHQEIQEAERATSSRRGLSSWDEDAADLKALEPLPLHNRHMAAANMQLARAVKLLDYGTVRATRYLRRYPYARVILLFYLVFVHLFLMYLLHRLQEQADSLSAREVAESMGLNNSNLQ